MLARNLLLVVLTTASGLAQSAEPNIPLTQTAKDFVSKGVLVTLKDCDLPNTCRNAKLLGKKQITGESNDEKRIVRTLYFDGLVTEVIFPVAHPKQVIIAKATVTKPNWPVDLGLKIGASRSAVLKTLGAPTSAHGSCIQYFLAEEQSSADFCFENNRVAKVEWERWVD